MIYVWGCGARPMGLCSLSPMGWAGGAIGPYGDFQSLCMGLRCLTYGALWGMQNFIAVVVSDLWGAQDCGARLMGICIVAVAVFSDLWGESMGL